MTLYKCVATDVNEGLIEVVQKAETLCKIQMRTGITPTSATFKKGLLKEWLKQHNPTVAEGCKAQEQFTLSCAGYSVAAYVLGIGDRHNDNVMVKTNGQMFHIGKYRYFLSNIDSSNDWIRQVKHLILCPFRFWTFSWKFQVQIWNSSGKSANLVIF